MSLDPFPVHSIAEARRWAAGLNEKVEAGVDPREALRIEQERAGMAVAHAHELYMEAVREARAWQHAQPIGCAGELRVVGKFIIGKIIVETTLAGKLIDYPAAAAVLKKFIPTVWANDMFPSLGRDFP